MTGIAACDACTTSARSSSRSRSSGAPWMRRRTTGARYCPFQFLLPLTILYISQMANPPRSILRFGTSVTSLLSISRLHGYTLMHGCAAWVITTAHVRANCCVPRRPLVLFRMREGGRALAGDLSRREGLDGGERRLGNDAVDQGEHAHVSEMREQYREGRRLQPHALSALHWTTCT